MVNDNYLSASSRAIFSASVQLWSSSDYNDNDDYNDNNNNDNNGNDDNNNDNDTHT